MKTSWVDLRLKSDNFQHILLRIKTWTHVAKSVLSFRECLFCCKKCAWRRYQKKAPNGRKKATPNYRSLWKSEKWKIYSLLLKHGVLKKLVTSMVFSVGREVGLSFSFGLWQCGQFWAEIGNGSAAKPLVSSTLNLKFNSWFLVSGFWVNLIRTLFCPLDVMEPQTRFNQ